MESLFWTSCFSLGWRIRGHDTGITGQQLFRSGSGIRGCLARLEPLMYRLARRQDTNGRIALR